MLNRSYNQLEQNSCCRRGGFDLQTYYTREVKI